MTTPQPPQYPDYPQQPPQQPAYQAPPPPPGYQAPQPQQPYPPQYAQPQQPYPPQYGAPTAQYAYAPPKPVVPGKQQAQVALYVSIGAAVVTLLAAILMGSGNGQAQTGSIDAFKGLVITGSVLYAVAILAGAAAILLGLRVRAAVPMTGLGQRESLIALMTGPAAIATGVFVYISALPLDAAILSRL